MISPLEIPNLLKGPWEHLLILTYGADLAFFEHALWRQLSNRCKNKLILADGRHYLQAYQDAERNGVVHYINKYYVFDGIFSPFSAHAKLILLTNQEEGRLLVGSGNLGLQGYASGGELFTLYEYNQKSKDALPSFVAVRNLLEKLLEGHVFRPVAQRHITHLFNKTPWLYSPISGQEPTIFHNLEESLLQKLKRAIGKEAIEEMWILSPFYDSQLKALEEVITELSPKKIHLLVQPGLTALDPKALKRVVNKYKSVILVHSVSRPGEMNDAYIHAKSYLLKSKKRAFCLQGSPNLSQVAMLRIFQNGNLELANLFVSSDIHSFDAILDELDIQDATENLKELMLEYSVEEWPSVKQDEFVLRGGDWDGQRVTLYYSGELPDKICLGSGNLEIPCKVVEKGKGYCILEIAPTFHELLDGNPAIFANLELPKDKKTSNVIYLWQRRSLETLLNTSFHEIPWKEVGDLNLKDEELENLLIDLDANLLIDRRSIWQLARKELPENFDKDDEVLRLDYADIDYDEIRRHPKIQQYRQNKAGHGSLYDHEPLQALLASILEHFQGLSDISYKRKSIIGNQVSSQENGEDAQSEVETSADESDRKVVQAATRRKIRRILKNFIGRYIKGLQSQDFQELVGHEVLIKNYAIFSHILWLLFRREELEHDFIAQSMVKMWKLFWGDHSHSGIYQHLDSDIQSWAMQFLHEYKSDSQMLASMYYCSSILIGSEFIESRTEVRNTLRQVMEADLLMRSTDTIEAAWVFLGNLLLYQPPSPPRIVQELEKLAAFELTAGAVRAICKEFGVSETGCAMEKQVVYREAVGQQIAVETIIIKDPKIQLDIDTAIRIFQHWQALQERDYYRITSGDGQRIFQYELSLDRGSYYNKETNDFQEILTLPITNTQQWKVSLQEFAIAAQILEKQISIKPTIQTSINETG